MTSPSPTSSFPQSLTPDSCPLTPVLPAAAYVHVPFCRHRCGYCNFTLVAGRDDLIEAYLAAIERELSLIEGRPQLQTLYLGGGTPTHLPPLALERLFALLHRTFDVSSDAEVTAEANPLDLDDARIAVLKSAGVNRVSLGVQSFDDAKLIVLERDHRRRDIAQAITQARTFARSVSLDLIYASPQETLEGWSRDLDEAIATEADHISMYGLTIEQGAAFYGRWLRGNLARAEESLEADMYELAIDRLATAGYEQYEVSNFARPGHRSRHNQVYWRGESYYAFGPGAAGYVHGRRTVNHRSTTAYLQRIALGESAVAESEELPPEERARERLVFGLRMLEGVHADIFHRETGYTIQSLVSRELDQLVDLGLLHWTGNRLHLTRAGLLVSDSIWPKFLG